MLLWKLTVDAQPKDEAAAADKATGVTAGTILENGRFAGTEKLTIWTKDAAKCTFAEVKLPTTLDSEYTYFVKDMNNAKSDEDHSANKNKGKYYVFSFCENGTVHAGAVTEVPTALCWIWNAIYS